MTRISTLHVLHSTIVVGLLVVASACGRGSAPNADGTGPRPRGSEAFARPLEIYRDLGFMTGSVNFPVVASFSTLAGPSDSSYVMLAVSIPNSALRYQRDGKGFFAEYTIDVTFMNTDSSIVKRFNAREAVRLGTFAETGRTDESVIFQQGIAIAPGTYLVRLMANDANSSRGFRMTDTLAVPAYGAGATIASPMLVYRATGRTAKNELPELISNPRHTVPYGGAAPLLYLEAYSATDPVGVRVLNESGTEMWSGRADLSEGAGGISYSVLEIPAANLPLGKFWVEVSDGTRPPSRTPLIMTISDQWMVEKFDDVLEFMRYIASQAELDSLKAGTPTQQRDAWERFWKKRDPLVQTELNEYRDQFFARVRYSIEAFREPGGRPGWNTDRGEVYIVLGQPDNAIERFVGQTADVTGKANAEEWEYYNVPGGRLTLLFYDRTGFGRFELVPSSAASFRNVADRIKRRIDAGGTW
jgi:GWxTD domain-containing protein